jgi:hypothetical protein
VTFSKPKVISTGGPSDTPNNEGADIAVRPDGAIYVAYKAVERSTAANTINIVKSTDCGCSGAGRPPSTVTTTSSRHAGTAQTMSSTSRGRTTAT